MNLPREWTAFGGASLALMGAALVAGARKHAEDNLTWRRQWGQAAGVPDSGPGDGRRLIAVYRAGGALVIAVGLGLAAAAASGRALSSARFGHNDARALGACFAALGLAFAALKLSRDVARGPRFLAADLPTSPLGERLAGAATWGLCALWIAFGLRLLTESLRL